MSYCPARGEYTDQSGTVRCLSCHRRVRECEASMAPDTGPIAGIDYDIPGVTDEDHAPEPQEPEQYTTELGQEIDDASDDIDW